MSTTRTPAETDTADGVSTFTVTSPATGEELGSYPLHSTDEVAGAVAVARRATQAWVAIGFAGRRAALDAWRAEIVRGRAELAELIHVETGKPVSDARLEITLGLEHLKWAARNAQKILGRRSVAPSVLTFNNAATVEYFPLGVVGVISPWNYPAYVPLISSASIFAGGNAIVLKPSELAPATGIWLAEAFRRAVPAHPVLQVVTGLGATGAALCRGGVDKIAFTGSTATGKLVMASCAENLVPVVMECGGKDALVVDADADLDAAADAAVWGAIANAGQTCVAVERAYVHEAVYDQFVTKVTELATTVDAGRPDSKIGPITLPKQVVIIREQIEDALARGGRALVGGIDGITGNYVQPTILVDVPEESSAVTEETFGPTLTIAKVRDADEAVQRVNASRYGLGSTVFSRRNGRGIADRIRSGATSVNGVLVHPLVPSLPLGGVGASGFGRVNGPDGLREFTYAKSTTEQRFPLPLRIASFSRSARVDKLVDLATALLHGRRRK
ncbi:aldehyde dehydrogenase family protein [[Mycobacterium] nativiensis]|uniref:Aldehyde dehydrogenase n=1 Tax=[Mycobacterium] nativiensis TaxID=2855503 RepID=A0ABU5XV64_9MYCO|nr:aldehyde dehydrogenase family protein [Mycolicibacter sp. MYC340]MEB3031833.1 aldehyde dehydrogenase family protein [Mycolicibacter sp. MYC340]